MPSGFLGMLAAVALFGQTALLAQAARPEFEVASIKPSPPDEFNRIGAGMHIDGSQVSFKFFSLDEYIVVAYRVKRYQISSPDWMASERFDITAKLPAGGSAKDIGLMLQSLLEDRFQMKMHRDSKEFPVYGLVVDKGGLKMQESPADSPKASPGDRRGFDAATTSRPGGITVDYGNGAYFTFADNKIEGRKLSFSSLAPALSAFMDRPVVDMTNLAGKYDFVLDLSPEDFRAMGIRSAISAGVALPPQAIQMAEAASGDSLTVAMQKLGLKLESRKAPLEVLAIDHAEKTPSDN
jgi:uncharacterized protein (TIGR03435 family)